MAKRIHLIVNGECAHCGPVELIERDGRPTCSIARKQQRKVSSAGHQHSRGGNLQPHGLTVKAAKALRDAVGACQICGSDVNLRVDHNHETGERRGVVCNGCNIGLGWLDKPGWLEAALAYLSGPGKLPVV